MRIEAHGVTTKAMPSEKNIATPTPSGVSHVRPRQSAHERHRQHRRDHGKVARMVALPTSFTASGNRRPVAAFVLRQVKMPHDVFHHHDGVIDQDADGKDQRKEGDAIQRVAIQIKARTVSANVVGMAMAQYPLRASQGHQDQEGDANHRNARVPEEFVGLLRRGFAVIPRDGDFDVVRMMPPLSVSTFFNT